MISDQFSGNGLVTSGKWILSDGKCGHGLNHVLHGSLTRYVKLRVAHAPGMPGMFSSPPWVNDHGMHHGFLSKSGHVRAVMHVGIANKRFPFKLVAGKTFPAFPAQPAILRIWQEAQVVRDLTPLILKPKYSGLFCIFPRSDGFASLPVDSSRAKYASVNLAIIGSDNDLSSVQCQANIRTSAC